MESTSEEPLYIPVEYEVDYLKEGVPKNPELQKSSLYSELADDNLSVMKEFSSFDLINGLFSAHKGQKEEDYEKSVYQFLTENMYPKFNRLMTNNLDQPILDNILVRNPFLRIKEIESIK